MRICVDIDGVVCHLREREQSYENLSPINGAVDSLRLLRAQGHYIILYAAGYMKTTDLNLDRVLAIQGKPHWTGCELTNLSMMKYIKENLLQKSILMIAQLNFILGIRF
jgi:hypothetical protein